MDIYSEYYNGDRKATVTLLRKSWDPRFNTWEVAMYVKGNVIQRTTLMSEPDAESLAEDFINGGSASGPSLLNEHIING